MIPVPSVRVCAYSSYVQKSLFTLNAATFTVLFLLFSTKLYAQPADQNFNSSSNALIGGLSTTIGGVTYSQVSPTSGADMATFNNAIGANDFVIENSDHIFAYNLTTGGNIATAPLGAVDFRFGTSDGSEFQMESMVVEIADANAPVNLTLTVTGYRDGSSVASDAFTATVADASGSISYALDVGSTRGGTLTFNGDWENVDEIRFTGGLASERTTLGIDDLDFAVAVAGGDTTPPEVTSIVRQSPMDATTNATSATFRVTFDEDVQNVSTNGSDFAISGAGSGGTATITGASSVSASIYDVTIGSINTDGLLDLGFAGGQDIQDLATNAFGGTNNGTEQTYTIDQTGATTTTPDLATSSDSGNEEHTAGATSDNRTNDLTPTFTGTTEVGASVTVSSSVAGSLGSASVDGSGNWTLTPMSDLATGAHTITAQATDALGNTGAVSGGLAIILDNTSPTVTLSSTASPGPTNSNPIPLTVTFSDEAENMKENDFVVSGGTTGNFVGPDSTTFTVEITPSMDGTVTVDLNAGRAFDLAGNPNTAATQFSIVYDGTAPVFSAVSPATSGSTNTANVGYTLSEAITSGTVTFTRTGGSPDPTPHVVALTGTELNAGTRAVAALTNAPTLVDGAIYTIAFNGTDAAGNTATTVSSTGVTFDTTVPTISGISPATNDFINALDVTYTLSEAAASGQFQIFQTSPSATFIGTFALTGSELNTGTFSGVLTNAPSLVNGSVYQIGFQVTDAAGNASSTFNQGNITFDTSAPTVSSVNVPSNATYTATQNLDFTVNFNENVTVNTTGGTPQLALTIGSTTRQAVYQSGSGSSALLFRYTVQTGDLDSDGITVGALVANGGTLRDGSGNDATLTLNSVGSTTAVLVDAVAPVVTSPGLIQFAPSVLQLQYTTDEVGSISFIITTDNSGTPTTAQIDAGFDFSNDGNDVIRSGSAANSTTGSRTLNVSGLTLSSTTYHVYFYYTDNAGNPNGSVLTASVLADVDGPTVSSVNVPANDTYTIGENLDFTVNFNENVNVVTTGGTPQIALTIGSTTRQATYQSGTGTSALLFRYTVASGDADTDGIVVGALAANGGTLRDAVLNDATLTLNSVGSTTAVLVDGAAPTVSSVAVPSNATYNIGGNLDFTVNFNENVNVVTTGGTPQIALTIGSTTRQATYQSGSGTSALLFRYTVVSGDADSDGIVVGALAPNGGTLRDASGNDATLTLNSVGSTTAVLVDGVAPTGYSVTIDQTPINGGNETAVSFTFANAEVTATYNYTFSSDGGGTSVMGSGTIASMTDQITGIDLSGLGDGTITLSVALTDVNGNAGGIVQDTETKDVVAPTVSSVTVPSNATYILSQNLDFTVNFSENVTVVTTGGTPQIALTIGSTTRQAVYQSGSGTSALLFRYTVQAGDSDTDGIVVGALAANGGTLRDGAGNDATLTLNSVGSTTAVLVDGIVPTVSSVNVPSNATYVATQNLDFTVNFNESVTVVTTGGTPQIALTIGSTTRQAVYQSGSGTSALLFRYTVQTGDLDTDGITVGALAANGGTLRDAAGNDATLTLNSVGSTTAVLVDAVAPTVTSVTVPSNATYVATQNLDFTVNFSENVTVVTTGGTPQIALTIGSTTRQAVYQSGSGTSALLFRYTVQTGDLDTDGIAVGALAANGGTLRDGAGNDAILTLNSVGVTTAVRVDAVAPTVSSVTVPSNATYILSQNLDFTVNFSENITVVTTGGSPQIALTIGSTTRQAVYQSGSGTSALLFRYTVQAGDSDTDGITVGALAANGGTLRDGAGNDATLTLNSVGSTTAVLVDGIVPTVSSVNVPSNATYLATQNLDFTVNFSDNVTVVTTGGTPQIALTIGSTTRQAAYQSGSGTSALLFRYTVQTGDLDTDGITVGALAANGGTLRDAAGNDATLTLNSVGSTTAVLVDAVAPTVTSVNVPSNATYVATQNLDFTVNFSENVTVVTTGGTPQIALTIGSTTRQAVYQSGSGSSALLFRYTVVTGDLDTDGIAVGALAANGGTLRDAAGNDATLTLNSVGVTTAVRVDAVVPTIAISTPIEGDGVVNAAEDGDVTISGSTTGTEDGQSVSISFTDGSSTPVTGTATVTSNAWTITTDANISGLNEGTITITADVSDAAGNAATQASQTVTFDKTAPVFSAVSPSSSSFVNTTNVGYTLSETITSGTVTYTQTGGTTDGSSPHTVNLTGTELNTGTRASAALTSAPTLVDGAVYTIAFNGADAAGNAATTISSTSVTFDTSAPSTTSFTRKTPTNEKTNADAVTFLATFSEDVMGVDMNDFAVTGPTGASISVSQVSASTYDVQISGGDMASLDATVGLNFNSPSITDLAGNALPNTEPGTDQTYTLDNTAPTITISTPIEGDGIVQAAESSDVEISGTTTGLEDGQSVTVSFSDGSTTAGPVNATVTSNAWTASLADISALNDGSITVTADVSDVAGNAATQASQTITLDQSPPTISITAPGDDVTNVDIEASITITFNENIQFGTGNIVLNDLDNSTTDLTIDASSPGAAASISGAVLTIANPSGFLEESRNYAIQIANTAIRDIGGNAFAGIANNTTYNFTTEAPPTISIADATLAEGNSGTANMTFAVTLDKTSPKTITLSYATSDNTATTADNDYTAVTATTLTFNPSETSKNVTVAVNGDTRDEDAETFFLDGTSPTNASFADNQGQGTITDDDDPPTVAFTSTASSGAESVSSAAITVDVSTASSKTITVNYAVTGTATGSGTDYTLADGTLTFVADDVSETITIASIVDDAILETNETVILTLSSPTNATLGTNTTHTYTIAENDNAAVTIADASLDEAAGTVTLTAALDNQVQGGFNVTITSADGTASQSAGDYTAVNSTLTFAGTAGETQTFTVTVADDQILEANETITLSQGSLSTSAAVNITDGATVTIINDDNATVTIADASGNEDNGNITVTLTLDSQVDGGLTVDVSTADGTATVADSDYTAIAAQTVTFAGTAGETQTLTVAATTDTKVEANETLTVSMSNVTATTVATSSITTSDTGTLTITNDDAAAVTIADASGAENAGAVTLTATLDNAVDGGFTVDVSTADGTATSTDYTSVANQTLTFAGTAGETQTFTVTPTADETVEGNETVTVSMGNLAATSLSVTISDQATLTITNDDNAPVITAGQTFPIEGILTSGQVIGTVVATDADDGTTFSGWTIVSGNTDNAFAIATGTGVLTVNDPSVIDLIATPSYTLTLTVTDGTNTSAQETITIEVGDGIAPTVSLSSDVGAVTNVAPITITATFSELVLGFELSDLTLVNATAANLTANDAQTIFTFDLTPAAEGTVSVNLAASVATDAVGNPSEASNSISYFYDITSPTVTLTTTAAAITSETSASIVIDFNEMVTGLEVEDIQTSSGTLSNLTGSGNAYMVEVAGLSEGTATITIPASSASDAAGNGNVEGSVSWEVDLTGPSGFSVTILNPAINDLNQDNFRFEITDAEASSTFTYSVASSGGGTAVTGSGSIDATGAGNSVDQIDVSGLEDGSLTLTVELTDQYSNVGNTATDDVNKNTEDGGSNGIAQGYSPNGDNIDDTWTIPGIEDLPNNVVTIFNRYGTKVWETTNYDNNDNAWDSQANVDNIFGSAGLPDGTYFYVIEFPGTNTDSKSGFVILKR